MLSVTLFLMKINSIIQCLKPGIDCSLYVDDFQICYRSSNRSIIKCQMQLWLNILQQWATDNGFRLSKSKTVCMHICTKRGLHLDPQHFLEKKRSKIKSLPKHPTHDAVFDNKYMKLFDARPNDIRTFGLHIKHILTASNLDFSGILETPSYFVLTPWYIRPPKIVLDLMHLKKDRADASIYQTLFMEIRDRYRDYIPVYADGSRDGNSVACATVFLIKP